MDIPTFIPSTIENIDYAVFEWIDSEMNIFCHTVEGYKKVPVKFSIQELSYLEYDKDSKDEKNTLKYPIISIIRQNFSKPRKKELSIQGSSFYSNSKNLTIPVFREINQDKTSDRSNADSKRYAGTLNSKKSKTKRPIYITYNIPIPTAININYTISVISNFQIQMNEIISPFLKFTKNVNGLKVVRNNHVYEIFFPEEFSNNAPDDITEAERTIEYTFQIIVKGYIHEADLNSKGPSVYKFENAPEIVFKAETIVESKE